MEVIVLHDRLGDVELSVEDDTLRDTLAEANAKTLADTLIDVQAKAHVDTLVDLVAEAEGTLSDLKTSHWSTLLLVLKHQFVTLLLCETLGNVDNDCGLDAITGRRRITCDTLVNVEGKALVDPSG